MLRAFDLAPMGELGFRWIGEEDWADAWKRHYAVQRIGRHWVVKPRWQAYAPRPGDLVLDLDPGMAFGTGLHPTTQLVLECPRRPGRRRRGATGATLLDLGTGSGILAIGAGRLGAAQRAGPGRGRGGGARGRGQRRPERPGGRRARRAGHRRRGRRRASSPSPGSTSTAAFDGALANIVARVIARAGPGPGPRPAPGRLAGGQRDHRRARGRGQRAPGGAGAAHRAAPAAGGLGHPALPAAPLAQPRRLDGRRAATGGAGRVAHRAPLLRPRSPGRPALVDLPAPGRPSGAERAAPAPGRAPRPLRRRGAESGAPRSPAPGGSGSRRACCEHHTPAGRRRCGSPSAWPCSRPTASSGCSRRARSWAWPRSSPCSPGARWPGPSGARGAGRKLERWRRIVTEAAEQSGRCVVPQVAPPVPFGGRPGRRHARRCCSGRASASDRSRGPARRRRRASGGGGALRLLVGPEGGFEPQEAAAAVTAGAFSATLGPRILRSETAALAAVALTCLLPVP